MWCLELTRIIASLWSTTLFLIPPVYSKLQRLEPLPTIYHNFASLFIIFYHFPPYSTTSYDISNLSLLSTSLHNFPRLADTIHHIPAVFAAFYYICTTYHNLPQPYTKCITFHRFPSHSTAIHDIAKL